MEYMYGIKSYEICEPSFGYIWDFFVYTGKNMEYNSAYEDQFSVGAKSIPTFAHNLLEKGFGIGMNNIFPPPTFLIFWVIEALILLQLYNQIRKVCPRI